MVNGKWWSWALGLGPLVFGLWPLVFGLWSAVFQVSSLSTQESLRLGRGPCPRSTGKATHHQAGPLNLNSLSGQQSLRSAVPQVSSLSGQQSLRSAVPQVSSLSSQKVSQVRKGTLSPLNWESHSPSAGRG